MSLLSNTGILRHMNETGAIVIEPFNREQLNNVSYDLTLGDTIARYRFEERGTAWTPSKECASDAFRLFPAGHRAEVAGAGWWLGHGERVLGHSREIAGGRVVSTKAGRVQSKRVAVTTHLQATSTAARIGISVCQCAGWGDIGFISPWTFEIQNHSPRPLWLPVGAVLAQVVFHEVEPPLEGTSYEQIGSYQQGADPVAIRAAWTPDKMLPKRLKVRP